MAPATLLRRLEDDDGSDQQRFQAHDGRPLESFDWTAGDVTVHVITGYDHGLTAMALHVHHAPVPRDEPSGDGESPEQPKIPGLVP